jgi:hypothetical protein
MLNVECFQLFNISVFFHNFAGALVFFLGTVIVPL